MDIYLYTILGLLSTCLISRIIYNLERKNNFGGKMLRSYYFIMPVDISGNQLGAMHLRDGHRFRIVYKEISFDEKPIYVFEVSGKTEKGEQLLFAGILAQGIHEDRRVIADADNVIYQDRDLSCFENFLIPINGGIDFQDKELAQKQMREIIEKVFVDFFEHEVCFDVSNNVEDGDIGVSISIISARGVEKSA